MDASAFKASKASVIGTGKHRDEKEWLLFRWFITFSLFLSFIFLSLLGVFDLLFWFLLLVRRLGLDRTCAWWKMPGAPMKVFKPPLNFSELF